MTTRTDRIRPDKLSAGDHIYNPTSRRWEPVKSARWDESAQRYFVTCGPLGHAMHVYGAGALVTRQRYY